MLLRTALCQIKKEEAEQFNGEFFRLPIPFVTEEIHIEKWDEKDLVLLVNPNAVKKEDKKSTIKKSFPVLSSRLVEGYLKWIKNMWYIIKNKPCTSLVSKFDPVKCLLAEEALE